MKREAQRDPDDDINPVSGTCLTRESDQVFMTRRDILECVHEPFGDAFYFGPERLSERYEKDAGAREKSGFSQTTYRTCLRHIEMAGEKVRTAQSPLF